MKKAIKSKYTESVTVIERAEWSISFYDVETRRHYERRVWHPVHGSDIYVQHRGGFYSIATEYNGKYDPQAISRREAVSAEELEAMTAEVIAHRAGKQYADDLTWEEVTRVYAYAVICNDADTEATTTAIVNSILQDRSKQPAQQATETTETAEQNARELEERAAIIAQIEDPQQREYIRATAEAHQWTPDETRENVAYYAANRTANAAARALLDAYADVIGEYPAEDDPETVAAYRVALDEITGTSFRATDEDREQVAYMVEAIARSARRPDLTKYETMKYLEMEPAPTYERHELEAYLGEPQDYDVDAIEAEATAYDPETGRTVWTVDSDQLAAICERYQIVEYYPATA